MKGSQINFYMTASDQERLEANLRRKFKFLIINSIIDRDGIRCLENGMIRDMGNENLKVYLIQPNMLEMVVTRELPNQSYKVIDDLRSPIIEFFRCYRTEGVFGRGRLYFSSGYYENDILVKKDDVFLKWAGSILSFTRKELTKEKDSFFYYGREAAKIKKNGKEKFKEF